MSKTKVDNSTIPTGNLIPITISYHIILILGYSVLLGGSELGYEFLDVFGVEKIFVEFISD